MKTLEELAKEFVCNVGCEPTEKQEMEIKALVMFGKAVLKECQPTPRALDDAKRPLTGRNGKPTNVLADGSVQEPHRK